MISKLIEKIQWPVLGLMFFFTVGWFLSQNSPVARDTVTFSSISRDPAAIKRVYDFSNLQGSALSIATKQRLISGAKVLYEDSSVGIELGHFVVKGGEGEKEL